MHFFSTYVSFWGGVGWGGDLSSQSLKCVLLELCYVTSWGWGSDVHVSLLDLTLEMFVFLTR